MNVTNIIGIIINNDKYNININTIAILSKLLASEKLFITFFNQ